jgi:hypothetical protein
VYMFNDVAQPGGQPVALAVGFYVPITRSFIGMPTRPRQGQV